MKNIALVLMIVLSSTFAFSQEEKRPEPVLCQLGETLWYLDNDGDGYGSTYNPICAVNQPDGYVDNADDCNDNDPTLTTTGYIQYRDQDNDGLGDPNTTIVSCFNWNGFVLNNDDQCPDEYGEYNGCPNITLNENYLYTTKYLVSTQNGVVDDDDKIESIIYYDGLGRAKQSIAKQAGGNKEAIIVPMVYDDFGRQSQEYLPYAREGVTGLYIQNPTEILNQINVQYQMKFPEDLDNTINPYSHKEFEESPLNRVVEQAAPGSDWAVGNGHTIKFEYKTNTFDATNPANPLKDNIKTFSVLHPEDNTEQTELVFNGYYPSTALYKAVTKDENWTSGKNHTNEEFKNKQGQIVLKRTYNDNDTLDTYYVYDDFGNLTYVIPPLASSVILTIGDPSPNVVSNLCYQYHYDFRNRLVEKKIPGKGWDYIIYDKLDRPILTQDANLRLQNKWLFTKYDAFSRVVYTGLYSQSSTVIGADNANRIQLQDQVNAQSTHYETKLNGSSSTIGGINIEYTNNTIPITDLTLHTIHYYDDYNFSFPTDLSFANSYNQPQAENTKSLTTASKVRVLGTNEWITTLNYYDEKARLIYLVSKNEYLNTYDWSKIQLDFVGKVIESTTHHKKSGQSAIETINANTYDHLGRLLTQIQTINNSIPELIVNNHYDGLGQLESKNVGGTAATSPEDSNGLQTIDYNYNIRGWLKQINNPDALGANLFGFQIQYNKPSQSTVNALYNGNISQTNWKTKSENQSKFSYIYKYDALNRIKSAQFSGGNWWDRYSVKEIEYDRNGNLTKLYRKGHIIENPSNGNSSDFDFMDKLIYTYQTVSNKLESVYDETGNGTGFKDGNTAGVDYVYDVNGNMTQDKNKQIAHIEYNHLNLPTFIYMDYGGNINYIYDATGVKLKKEVSPGGNQVNTHTIYSGSYTYEETIQMGIMGPISSGVKLKFINQPEGYIEPNTLGSFDYIYQYKDHLGNIRLSYKDIDKDGTISEAGIFNDDFESASGWDSQGALNGGSVTAYDDSFKYSGEYSAKISTLNGGSKYVHSNSWVPINNTQLTEYIYSGWAYSNGPGIRVLLFMNKNEETSYFTQIDEYGDYTSKNTWVYFEKSVMVPSNIDKLNIRIESFYGTPGSVWYDDIKLKKADSEILEEHNYYPFGGSHIGYNNVINGTHHPYGFGGKEENDELGLQWMDFGARNYDKWLGRWMNIDPLAEQMYSHSPYSYAFNNPIYFYDADGNIPLPQIVNYSSITSTFGLRFHPIQKKWKGHGGVDLGASTGSSVRSAARGKVAKIGWDPDGYGRYIVIQHTDGYYTIYGHLEEHGTMVSLGDNVSNGQLIASSGNTGGSTGPHLHFEIAKANSLSQLLGKNRKDYKIDPQSIYDLDVKLHGVEMPSLMSGTEAEWALFWTDFESRLSFAEDSSNSSSSSEPRATVSPVNTISPVGPVITPTPGPSGGAINLVVPGGGSGSVKPNSPPIIIPEPRPDNGNGF